MTRKQENIRLIRKSLDVAYCRSQLILSNSLWIILGALNSLRFEAEYRTKIYVVMTLVVLAFSGYHLWRLIRIFRSPEEYLFCNCKLGKPWYDSMTNATGFVVLIEDPESGTVIKRTNPIFFSRGIGVPLLKDYRNQTVTIGYNRATGAVVVLNRLKEGSSCTANRKTSA